MMHVISADENELATLFAGPIPERSTLRNSFLSFAITAERVCSVSKRIEKSHSVAVYFESLTDDDLVRAARFLAGQIFPLQERRSLHVGQSTIISALSRILGVNANELKARKEVAGDLGTIAFDLFDRQEWTARVPASLTLAEVCHALHQISTTPGTKLKTERLKDLLKRGTPLEVKYLVKMVTGDLRIGLQESTVEDALARWTGTDPARVQRANMLVGDIGETALLAKHGELDSARPALFRPIRFMLATAADLIEAGSRLPEQFFVEDKFDGVRVQVHLGLDLPEMRDAPGLVYAGIRVALFSRSLQEVTAEFPEILPALCNLLPGRAGAVAANGLILDGEIIPMREGKILPIAALRTIMSRDAIAEPAIDQSHLVFVACDILVMDGRVLIQEPLVTRTAALNELAYDSARTWRVTTRQLTDPRSLASELESALARGNKGIVIKDPLAVYRPGRRSMGWLKVKHSLSTLDVVVTVAETGMRKTAKALTNYTIAVRASKEDPRLLEIGKTNLGLEDSEAVRLAQWFRAHTLQQYAQGKVRRVLPKIVLEVAFAKVKPSRRYESGFALERARIIRIRDDKPVAEIDTLETVRKWSEIDADCNAE